MNRLGLTHRSDPAIQRYIADAISFRPRPPCSAGPQGPLRVASTLLTCSTAAAVLNELQVPAEPSSAYFHLNVHNPRCPLFFDPARAEWACVPGFETHPAWGFNWAGARLVCEHMGARLPSEQEWQCFASNNDPSRTFPWGNEDPSPVLANFGEHIGGTSPVASFPASEIGLYDLAGNLGEWCQDIYRAHPEAPAGRSVERIVKGGAWSKDSQHLSIAAQRGKWERLGTTTIGIRPVWDD